jgi:hypothetical protein
MLVREIKPEIYEEIKSDDEIFCYSYVKRSKVNQRYIDAYFFKAEHIEWSPYENAPYVRIIENLGPIYDEPNYRKIVMLN